MRIEKCDNFQPRDVCPGKKISGLDGRIGGRKASVGLAGLAPAPPRPFPGLPARRRKKLVLRGERRSAKAAVWLPADVDDRDLRSALARRGFGLSVRHCRARGACLL
jgi:hypothetical protein